MDFFLMEMLKIYPVPSFIQSKNDVLRSSLWWLNNNRSPSLAMIQAQKVPGGMSEVVFDELRNGRFPLTIQVKQPDYFIQVKLGYKTALSSCVYQGSASRFLF